MPWNRAEIKAIGKYANLYNYRLVLCMRPIVVYRNSKNKEIKVNILTVMNIAAVSLKDEAAERSRTKKAAQREAQYAKFRTDWRK